MLTAVVSSFVSPQVNVMVLQLVNGSVEAVFGREGEEMTRLVSNLYSYDDGEWHSVSVSKVNARE